LFHIKQEKRESCRFAISPVIHDLFSSSVITRTVTLDIPRIEEEEEEKQTVDELQWKW